MFESINIEHMLYSIYLKLENDYIIKVGKLRVFSFQKGTYINVGNCKRKPQNKEFLGILLIFVHMEQLLEL